MYSAPWLVLRSCRKGLYYRLLPLLAIAATDSGGTLPLLQCRFGPMRSVSFNPLPPMLASSAAPFDDAQCLFEVKWDGVRAMTLIRSAGIQIWGRELQDYTPRYAELETLRRLPKDTLLDGELVL